MISISVLIPVYNGERFLQESLDSIYGQSFTDYEIIIIDDGSSDNTQGIIENQTDSRIKYYKNEHNMGIIASLNRGIELCQGKYIARMDADDIAEPERLKTQFGFLENNPNYVLLGSSITRFSESYTIIENRGSDDENSRAKLLFDTCINHPSAMLRTSIIKEHNLKYSKDFIHAEDYAFWVEMSKYGAIGNLDAALLRYRLHGDNISMKFNEEQYLTMNKIRISQLDIFWNKAIGANETWMRDYTKLSNLKYASIDNILSMDSLLGELLATNQKHQIYNQCYLAMHAAWFWYVVYTYEKLQDYNPILFIKIVLNTKSVFHKLTSTNKLKFLLKCISFNKLNR